MPIFLKYFLIYEGQITTNFTNFRAKEYSKWTRSSNSRKTARCASTVMLYQRLNVGSRKQRLVIAQGASFVTPTAPHSPWNLRSKWPTPFWTQRLRWISAHSTSNVQLALILRSPVVRVTDLHGRRYLSALNAPCSRLQVSSVRLSTVSGRAFSSLASPAMGHWGMCPPRLTTI